MDAVQCEIVKVLLQRLLELGLIGESVYDRAADLAYESFGCRREEDVRGCAKG